MSGKNSIIVDDDADLDEAAQATMASAFGFSGQNCTACSHVIVVGSVYAALLEKLIDASSAIRPGPADSPATTVGPLINAKAVASAKSVVDSCMGDAKCVLPMKFPQHPDEGFFVSPAIFADVTADAAIAREECMAPVLGVMRAGSFDEAVAIANRSTNAHWVGVYSRSPRNIEFAKRRLRSGNVQINRKITLSRVGRRPVGVFGRSEKRDSWKLEIYQSQMAEQQG
ncbi:MAG: aldehyde dehydrogenase family protein [Planctomycetes bacterium]|nr:aldehyde dehydrogenase family protein [Planctomycetota bacterium]